MNKLSKILINNMRNSFKSKALYLGSIVFSIIVYFTFVSIQYNDIVNNIEVFDGKYGEVVNLASSFKLGSIQIAIFIAIFVFYSTLFFTKRRKKEIALYSLLGMKKIKVGAILFIENIIMTTIALITGILIGSLTSNLSTKILVKIMDMDVNVTLQLIPKAIINTVIVFGIITLITSVQTCSLIYRFKLIELFKADKIPQKEPKTSIILFAISIVMINKGLPLLYMLNTSAPGGMSIGNLLKKGLVAELIIPTLVMSVGIYLLFSTLIIILLKLCKKNKASYYKSTNMIGISGVLYRIKSNSIILALICLLSTIGIINLASSAVNYYDTINIIEKNSPFSYVYYNNSKNISFSELNKKVDNTIKKYPENKIVDSIEIEWLKFMSRLPEKDQLARPYYIIPESKYIKITEINKSGEKLNLKKNEFALYDNSYYKNANNFIGLKLPVNLKNGKRIKLKLKKINTYLLANSNSFEAASVQIVVSDETYKNLYENSKKEIHKIRAINIANEGKSKELTNKLKTIIPAYSKSNLGLSYSVNVSSTLSSYYETKTYNLGGVGSTLFLSTFLGLIFLTCAGSVLFFKQISEAIEDKEKYIILKKMGCSKKSIKMTVIQQLLFIFIMPLIISIILAYTQIEYVLYFVSNSIVPISITLIMYILVYLIYCAITTSIYYKIVYTNNNSIN